jgi:hypothetical protein
MIAGRYVFSTAGMLFAFSEAEKNIGQKAGADMKKFLLFLVCFGVCFWSLPPADAGVEDLIRKGETLDLRRYI